MQETLHIYTRVSTRVQDTDGTSLDTQRDLGISRSEEMGFSHKVWNEGGASSHHEDLENKLSSFLKKEDTILLNFGYQGIMSSIDALVDRKDVIVYDIIYQPNYTLLLNFSKELGLKTLNGLEMNFEQAVLAYNYAVPGVINIEKTRKAMKAVIK